MTESLVIDIPTLRRAIDHLLDHLEEANGAAVALSPDYFWAIPDTSRYDPYEQPGELTIGQLTESWQWLVESVGSDAVVSRNLSWAAEILAAIATEAKP